MTVRGPCRILLIGMMGSGKSTIGELLSTATGWPYVDNDELVRRSHGATVREIAAEQGEDEMRAAEADALALGVDLAPPAMVGVAAGTILDPINRDRMRTDGIVVWLRADPAVLSSRAMGGDHRPFLGRGGEGWMRDTAAERDPLYASVADIVIDTGAGSAADSAAEILARLRTIESCA